jgi:hypothetical protein
VSSPKHQRAIVQRNSSRFARAPQESKQFRRVFFGLRLARESCHMRIFAPATFDRARIRRNG